MDVVRVADGLGSLAEVLDFGEGPVGAHPKVLAAVVLEGLGSVGIGSLDEVPTVLEGNQAEQVDRVREHRSTLKGVLEDEAFAAPGGDAEEVKEGTAHLVSLDVFLEQGEHEFGEVGLQVTYLVLRDGDFAPSQNFGLPVGE